jgi:hypothetical protein
MPSPASSRSQNIWLRHHCDRNRCRTSAAQ